MKVNSFGRGEQFRFTWSTSVSDLLVLYAFHNFANLEQVFQSSETTKNVFAIVHCNENVEVAEPGYDVWCFGLAPSCVPAHRPCRCFSLCLRLPLDFDTLETDIDDIDDSGAPQPYASVLARALRVEIHCIDALSLMVCRTWICP